MHPNCCQEYSAAIATIGSNDAEGKQDIGGPSICCNWVSLIFVGLSRSINLLQDLNAVLQAGYLTKFSSALKYIVYVDSLPGLPHRLVLKPTRGSNIIRRITATLANSRSSFPIICNIATVCSECYHRSRIE